MLECLSTLCVFSYHYLRVPGHVFQFLSSVFHEMNFKPPTIAVYYAAIKEPFLWFPADCRHLSRVVLKGFISPVSHSPSSQSLLVITEGSGLLDLSYLLPCHFGREKIGEGSLPHSAGTGCFNCMPSPITQLRQFLSLMGLRCYWSPLRF